MALDLASLLGSKNAPLIGVDISTSDVKLVELSRSGEKDFKLERCATEPLPKGAVIDGNVENLEQVSEAISRVLKRAGTGTRQVALAMPAASVITKKMILPANLNEQALEFQVESEASQYIPFSMDEVAIDFAVVGPTSNSDEDMDVLLAAARKEKIEDRVAAAESAGLQAKVMDIESFAARAAVLRLIEQLPNAGRIRFSLCFK